MHGMITSGLTHPWHDNNNNNNNSNFFCANILENQAQWRDKTRGLINLIIESNDDGIITLITIQAAVSVT